MILTSSIFKRNTALKAISYLTLSIATLVTFAGCFGGDDSAENTHSAGHEDEFTFEGNLLATGEHAEHTEPAHIQHSNDAMDLGFDDLFDENNVVQSVSVEPVTSNHDNRPPTTSKQDVGETMNLAIQKILDEQNKKINELAQESTRMAMLLEQEREKNQFLKQNIAGSVSSGGVDPNQYNALLKDKVELEQRLRALEAQLMGASNSEPVTMPAPVVSAKPIPNVPSPRHFIPKPIDFSIQAEVTYVNGKTSMAFFTPFYITTQSLDEIVKGISEDLLQKYNIESAAELWARAIKNPYEYPDVANQIRRALTTSRVARASTNMEGSAEFKEVLTGDYYIIGAAPLGQVGVVWSLPLELRNNNQDLYLNGENAAWSL